MSIALAKALTIMRYEALEEYAELVTEGWPNEYIPEDVSNEGRWWLLKLAVQASEPGE